MEKDELSQRMKNIVVGDAAMERNGRTVGDAAMEMNGGTSTISFYPEEESSPNVPAALTRRERNE